MIGKQPIIALYFEFENELKFYNLEAWSLVVPFLGIDCCILSFHSWESFFVSCFHVIFSPPPLACTLNQCVYHMLTECTTRMLHMSKSVKPSFPLNEVEFFKLKPISSSLDLTVATSLGMILRICVIMTQLCVASAEGSAWSTAKFHWHLG